jgi:hypothetical protein
MAQAMLMSKQWKNEIPDLNASSVGKQSQYDIDEEEDVDTRYHLVHQFKRKQTREELESIKKQCTRNYENDFQRACVNQDAHLVEQLVVSGKVELHCKDSIFLRFMITPLEDKLWKFYKGYCIDCFPFPDHDAKRILLCAFHNHDYFDARFITVMSAVCCKKKNIFSEEEQLEGMRAIFSKRTESKAFWEYLLESNTLTRDMIRDIYGEYGNGLAPCCKQFLFNSYTQGKQRRDRLFWSIGEEYSFLVDSLSKKLTIEYRRQRLMELIPFIQRADDLLYIFRYACRTKSENIIDYMIVEDKVPRKTAGRILNSHKLVSIAAKFHLNDTMTPAKRFQWDARGNHIENLPILLPTASMALFIKCMEIAIKKNHLRFVRYCFNMRRTWITRDLIGYAFQKKRYAITMFLVRNYHLRSENTSQRKIDALKNKYKQYFTRDNDEIRRMDVVRKACRRFPMEVYDLVCLYSGVNSIFDTLLLSDKVYKRF